MTDGLIILVDQDGPLADFDAHFHRLCTTRGYPMHGGAVHADARCPEHRFATDCLTGNHGKLARLHVNESRWFLDLPVVDGAVEGLNALADHPDVAEVWICTKPLEANPHCQSDKANWIRTHFGEEWLRRLIITPDKSMVQGDLLLDDAPKPAWFARAAWTPVLFPMSWNQPGSPFIVHGGLDDVPRWQWGDPIEQLIEHAGESAWV